MPNIYTIYREKDATGCGVNHIYHGGRKIGANVPDEELVNTIGVPNYPYTPTPGGSPTVPSVRLWLWVAATALFWGYGCGRLTNR